MKYNTMIPLLFLLNFYSSKYIREINMVLSQTAVLALKFCKLYFNRKTQRGISNIHHRFKTIKSHTSQEMKIF